MTNLLPPSESTPELEAMAADGRCPVNKDRRGAGPCGAPSKAGAPAGACADHEAETRAEIARRLPGLEKAVHEYRTRQKRAGKNLADAEADLAWYRENAR